MYQFWGTPGNLNNNYGYIYDKLNRLTFGGSNATARENVGYDLMGNITWLTRYQASTRIDALTYSYLNSGNNTNQAQTITDTTSNIQGLLPGITSYTYDGNGNMLSSNNPASNNNQNKTITYNLLNLPQTLAISTTAGGTSTLTYTYDAAGNKLRRKSTGLNNTTDYIAGIQYDGATTPAFSFVQTEEGKATYQTTTGGFDYVYYLGDNLGNTRVTFDTQTGSAATLQKDDYYPFGMEIVVTAGNPKNEYLYNKKELQEEQQEYDYGARYYDPVIARWTGVDPLAEKLRRWSPYNYVVDNPISFTDPDGADYQNGIYGNGLYGNTLAEYNGEGNPYITTGQIAHAAGAALGSAVQGGGGPKTDKSKTTATQDAIPQKPKLHAQTLKDPVVSDKPDMLVGPQQNATIGTPVEPVNLNDAGLPSTSQAVVGSAWDTFTIIDGAYELKTLFWGAEKIAINGETTATKLGKFMHSIYRAGEADNINTFKEFTGIDGIRPDFVNFQTKTIYELKPNNPRAIREGLKQLDNYKAAFEKHYGGTWNVVLDKY